MELRDYQKDISGKAAHLLRVHGIAYLSMECRTGKSVTALAAAEKFGARRVLFLTKKKAIPSVLSDYKAIHGVTPPYVLEVLNYESAHKAGGSYDLAILDEAHCLGAYPRPTSRTKSVKSLCNGIPCLYLSGTPTPESFSQLYHQFWVCCYSPFARWTNFYKWAHDFVDIRQRKINGYMINDYSMAYKGRIDKLTKHLFLSYTQSASGFHADIREHDEIVPMSEKSREIFERLYHDLVYNFADGEVVLADTPAKKLTKLHQISSGTVKTENGPSVIVDYSKALYIRDRFKGKLAIFYVYEAEFEMLKKIFPWWTDDPEVFQSSNVHTFICQVRRAREGVRLDSADALIFFNLEYSYLSYEQGKNRILSKERCNAADIYFLCSDYGVEKAILSAVRAKKDFTLIYYTHGEK